MQWQQITRNINISNKAQKVKSVIITRQSKTTPEKRSECSNEMKQFIAKKAFNGSFDCIIKFAEYYSFSKKFPPSPPLVADKS